MCEFVEKKKKSLFEGDDICRQEGVTIFSLRSWVCVSEFVNGRKEGPVEGDDIRGRCRHICAFVRIYV